MTRKFYDQIKRQSGSQHKKTIINAKSIIRSLSPFDLRFLHSVNSLCAVCFMKWMWLMAFGIPSIFQNGSIFFPPVIFLAICLFFSFFVQLFDNSSLITTQSTQHSVHACIHRLHNWWWNRWPENISCDIFGIIVNHQDTYYQTSHQCAFVLVFLRHD